MVTRVLQHSYLVLHLYHDDCMVFVVYAGYMPYESHEGAAVGLEDIL